MNMLSEAFIVNLTAALCCGHLKGLEALNAYDLARSQYELGLYENDCESEQEDDHEDDPYVHVHGIC